MRFLYAYLARWVARHGSGPPRPEAVSYSAIVVGTLYQVGLVPADPLSRASGPMTSGTSGWRPALGPCAAIEAQRDGIALVRTGHADG